MVIRSSASTVLPSTVTRCPVPFSLAVCDPLESTCVRVASQVTSLPHRSTDAGALPGTAFPVAGQDSEVRFSTSRSPS